MHLTYDPEADAIYIQLVAKVHAPKAKRVDKDIILDFDDNQRLLGIEASKRLNLDELMSVAEIIGEPKPGRTKFDS